MLLAKLRRQMQYMRFHLLHLRTARTIRRWQTERLRRLLARVSAHIPLYRALLAEHSINPLQIASLDDMPLLPITSKALFFDKPVREYTNRSRPLRGYWAQTSGSSGTPFTPLRREHVRLPWYGDSLHYRFLFWDRPWLLRANWARIAHIRVLSSNRQNHIVVPVTDFLNDTARAVDLILQFKPDIIETHASLLHELATYVQQHRIPLRPQYVVSVSENLSDAAREAITAALQCPVYNRYGLEEFGTVGVECKEHNGFHINCESFIVEIVDAEGALCSENTFGRVLVTDLYNSDMPFIRYDTGDYGKISWQQCRCGLYAPRLWIEGRFGATLTLSGKRYHHFEFDAALDSFMNAIVAYQVVKLSEQEIVVRVIPGPKYNSDCATAIVRKLEERIGDAIKISVENVRSIPRVPQGKSQIIRDESSAPKRV